MEEKERVSSFNYIEARVIVSDKWRDFVFGRRDLYFVGYYLYVGACVVVAGIVISGSGCIKPEIKYWTRDLSSGSHTGREGVCHNVRREVSAIEGMSKDKGGISCLMIINWKGVLYSFVLVCMCEGVFKYRGRVGCLCIVVSEGEGMRVFSIVSEIMESGGVVEWKYLSPCSFC